MANRYASIVEKLQGSPTSLTPQQPVSEEELNQLESQLGYSLPADYREFLRDYSGYGFSNALFWHETEFQTKRPGSVFMFYSASLQGQNIAEQYQLAIDNTDVFPAEEYPGLSLLRPEFDEFEEIPWPPELMPIACDMGGNQICLALFGLRPNAIFKWMNVPDFNDQSVYLLANSFDEFIKMIHPPLLS